MEARRFTIFIKIITGTVGRRDLMNILFTSAGRRGYLVEYFKEALGNKGEIHVANSSEYSTAMKYGDKCVVTPLIYEEDYIPFLKEYCKRNKISVLIPLIDVDLPILAENTKEFDEIGVRVIVSKKDVINICNDKWETFNFLLSRGFNTPLTFLSVPDALNAINIGKVSFPLIIKPRWGMGSISIFEADNLEELNVFYNKARIMIHSTYLTYESRKNSDNCIIIQEKIDGQEYGLDIINDLHGNYVKTIVKKKLAMRSGETDIAETIQNRELEQMGEQLGKALGHIGNLDTDAFLVKGIPYTLEMNARFGGGYPFSHIAGVNLPKAIVKWIKDEQVEKSILEPKLGVIGYKDITIIH